MVEVADRFGHHGIVGFMAVNIPPGSLTQGVLEVDTFVLSCRSLHLVSARGFGARVQITQGVIFVVPNLLYPGVTCIYPG